MLHASIHNSVKVFQQGLDSVVIFLPKLTTNRPSCLFSFLKLLIEIVISLDVESRLQSGKEELKIGATDLDKLKLERERLTEMKSNLDEKNKQMKEGKVYQQGKGYDWVL